MAFNFLRVYFKTSTALNIVVVFHDDDSYMPILERRDNNNWVRDTVRGNRFAQSVSRQIRS